MTHKNRVRLGILAVVLSAFSLAVGITALMLTTREYVPPDPKTQVLVDGTEVYSTGWTPDPQAVDAVVATLPFKTFADTPAGQAGAADIPDHVYQWEAYKDLPIRAPPVRNQGSVGSCVSMGTNNAIERALAIQIAIGKKAEEWHQFAEEITYAGSRVEVGGGRIRGDGSVGAWAAQFAKTYGVLPKAVYGSFDLRQYSESRCRSWGNTGVPDELEPTIREHPVQEITKVLTWDSFKKVIANGDGLAICSNQGFSMQRDSRGVAKAQGEWAHCMCGDGYYIDKATGKEYGHIVNSWGPNAHTGPVGWGEPGTDGFWAESGVIARMLAQGDSWAFSGVKGFPKRRIDWLLMKPPVKINRLYASLQITFPN